MKDVILRNVRAEQYICAAKKNFIMRNAPDCLSESTSKLVIGHITDLHGDYERFENAMSVFEHLKPDFVVHTGDLVKWNMDDDYSFFYDRIQKSPIPVYNCVGNHDTFKKSGNLSASEMDTELVKPIRNIINSDGEGYYYVDFPEKEIRLIVLNDYQGGNDKCAILQSQCEWMIEVLIDSVEKNLGVILASHENKEDVSGGANDKGFCQRYSVYPWGTPMPKPLVIADIIDAFRNGKSLCKQYTWWYGSGAEVEINCQFDKKGDFICYLCGHRHGDFIGYLPSYPDQLSVTMTCSGCFPPDYHNIGEEASDLPRIPQTASEDAINFYVIDRKKKTLTAVRYGACVNDLFEERLVAEYEYNKDRN